MKIAAIDPFAPAGASIYCWLRIEWIRFGRLATYPDLDPMLALPPRFIYLPELPGLENSRGRWWEGFWCRGPRGPFTIAGGALMHAHPGVANSRASNYLSR